MNEYIKTPWKNGQAPALNAENLNKIEKGIEDVTNEVNKKPSAKVVCLGTGTAAIPNIDTATDPTVIYHVNRYAAGLPIGWAVFCGNATDDQTPKSQIRHDSDGKIYTRTGELIDGEITWEDSWKLLGSDDFVPIYRKITDTLDLSEDITTEQLRAVLGVSKRDIVYTNEVFKTLDEATDQYTLYSVFRTMYGAYLGRLRYHISTSPGYITEMQIWLHETGKITYRTKVTAPTTSGEWSNWIKYLTNEDSYTKNEVNDLISAISTLSFEVSQTKPVSDIKTNVIYLIPKSDTDTENVFDEWIYVNSKWELIGNTSIDLSQYAQKSELPTKVSELQNDSGYLTQHQDLSAYSTKQEVNSALATKADSAIVKILFTTKIIEDYFDSEVLPRYNVLEGRRLVSSGGGATDENYNIDRFYPLTAGSLLKIKATADSDYVYQFQSALSIGSTNLVAGPFSGAIDDFVVVPDSAVCLSICRLVTNTTNSVMLYTAKNAASKAALKSTVKQDSEAIEHAELDELGEIEAEQSAVDEDK